MSTQQKISFKNDYAELCQETILEDLLKISRKQFVGYGLDSIGEQAKKEISRHFSLNNVDIHFFTSGTQTNAIFINSVLKPFEAVIATDTAHISVHETGAIEHNGNKIVVAPNADGKILVSDIQRLCEIHSNEHMVRPRMVFISQSTELGTIYSKQELQTIYKACKKLNLYLYIDGARLGSALTSLQTDIKKQEYKDLCDAFYIGGNKNGSLIGEALIIINNNLKADFRFHMKQKGALVSKGYLLASCFNTLFKDNLFFDLAKHANEMAQKMRLGMIAKGYKMSSNSSTNMFFPIVPNETIIKLQKQFDFYVIEKHDETSSVIRLICSWATCEGEVEKFISLL